jgi:hypothetical protein
VQNVQGLDIFRVKSPAPSGSGNFVLKDVSDLQLGGTRGTKDISIDRVEEKTL